MKKLTDRQLHHAELHYAEIRNRAMEFMKLDEEFVEWFRSRPHGAQYNEEESIRRIRRDAPLKLLLLLIGGNRE